MKKQTTPKFPAKPCTNCLQVFQPKRAWQLFCKRKCRNDYNNAAYRAAQAAQRPQPDSAK